MADATSGATVAPAAAGTQPPAGNPAAAPVAGAGGQAGQGQGSQAPSDGQQSGEPDAKGFREELKAAKARAKAAEERLAALEAANLTAAEKQQKQIADRERVLSERETALQERSLRVTVQAEASRLGFANPTVAARLLDREQLTFDEDGTPTNVEPLLKALLKSEPYLGAASVRPGIDQGARDGGGSGLTLEQIRKMSQAEITARYDEVMAAMGAKV